MKRQLGLVMVAILLSAISVTAQSAEEQVEQAVLQSYQHLANGNAAGWVSFVGDDGHGNFARTGYVLATNPVDPVTMQANFDSGALSYELVVNSVDVSTYGNTAVATFYTTGPSELATGERIAGTHRVTQVWVRQSGDWKIVHIHISPLVA